MRADPVTRAAAVVLAAEAVGLLVLTAWQVLVLLGGDTTSVASSIALIVLTLVGALAVGAFAVAVMRDSGWARSGGTVVQLMTLAIAVSIVDSGSAHVLLGLGMGAVGAVGLVLLIIVIRRVVLRDRGAHRDDDGDAGSPGDPRGSDSRRP